MLWPVRLPPAFKSIPILLIKVCSKYMQGQRTNLVGRDGGGHSIAHSKTCTSETSLYGVDVIVTKRTKARDSSRTTNPKRAGVRTNIFGSEVISPVLVFVSCGIHSECVVQVLT